MLKKKKAILVLQDGTAYSAEGIGACCTKAGELVFNTSMTGYQEALSDPSYAGQILIMTYPLIGNYGFSKEWQESDKVYVRGFCVRMAENAPTHFKSGSNLDKFLQDNEVGAIVGLDTRSIVRKIRNKGVMPAALQIHEAGEEPDMKTLLKLAKETDYSKIDCVTGASCKKIITHGEGKIKIALIDYGAKGNIINELLERKMQVMQFPHNASAEEIKKCSPHGIILSNGPGDPARLGAEVNEIKKLLDFPIMGICLGHQLLGCAAGAKTYKLKFGHRGSNHPVMDLRTKKVAITTQNHGYALDEKTISNGWEITHLNLNDNTVEGIAHKTLPIFSVQFHPEAHPGPRDSEYLFDKFLKLIKDGKNA
ncbi:carbamoyl phosphate synthase small subunit [Candidatus Micrarchaeota archaeon CG10_big_fil_rev_8_21_14_0_10_45_29]|nr:MAG: carbamoyl phosphate synthase small subunit [Candidatus Micrarchaeota archaeon CG10_big_fil_rev_8_21_14_0_10_45_29]